MSNEVINPDQQFLNAAGHPLGAGTLTFNVNLTSNIDVIYSDEALMTTQANPYTLDASGRILGDVKYRGKKRMIVKNVSGETLRTLDNVVTSTDINGVITTIATFAALASTPANIGQQVCTKGHTISGKGANKFQAYAGSASNAGAGNNGTDSPSATAGIYWEMIQKGDLSVEDFGVIGNAVRSATVDEYTNLQNAITVTGNRLFNTKLFFPKLYYKTSQTLVISSPMTIIGSRPSGGAFPGLVPATDGTEIVWSGGASAVIFCENINSGLHIENLTIDGNNAATYCIHADTVNFGRFVNIWCRYSAIFAFYLDARNGTCSWNTFDRLRCSNGYGVSATAALALGGTEASYNACHNTFINTMIEHAGNSHGILLGFCDNCTWLDVFTNRGTASYGGAPASTGYGLTYSASGSSYAYGNSFYHLQSGAGGYYEPPGSYGGVYQVASIYGYALDNTEPIPILATYNGFAGTVVVFNSGDTWIQKTLGVNTAGALSYPLVVKTRQTGSRGTTALYGQAHYLGNYDDQTFDMTGCTINASGTISSRNGTAGSGSASFINHNGSEISAYCAANLTTADVITPNDAIRAYTFTNSGSSTWTYGVCSATPSLKKTGYGTPTGAVQLINFPGATATLAQTSGALADLLAELKSKGFIGA